MNWELFIYPSMRYFRLRRLGRFVRAFPDLSSLSVLDIEGRPMLWDLLNEYYGLKPRRLLLLNEESEINRIDGYETVIGDGCHLAYEDNAFDLVFSNSVIEHVGDLSRMRQFVHECTRVGKEIYIQTPNRWFPVEPLTVALFIHWFPKRIFKRLGFLTIAWWVSSSEDFYRACDDFYLLSRDDFIRLSPSTNLNLWEERVFGFVKSFVLSSRLL